MYLHIGGDMTVSFREIVGVFDINTSDSEPTKEFLRIALEEGFIKYVCSIKEAKSFIVSNQNRVYYSPIASSTLRKRWEQLSFNTDDDGP
jgi:hypothetical protein